MYLCSLRTPLPAAAEYSTQRHAFAKGAAAPSRRQHRSPRGRRHCAPLLPRCGERRYRGLVGVVRSISRARGSRDPATPSCARPRSSTTYWATWTHGGSMKAADRGSPPALVLFPTCLCSPVPAHLPDAGLSCHTQPTRPPRRPVHTRPPPPTAPRARRPPPPPPPPAPPQPSSRPSRSRRPASRGQWRRRLGRRRRGFLDRLHHWVCRPRRRDGCCRRRRGVCRARHARRNAVAKNCGR